VLMLDARNIGQLMRGSRKVYEFTREQLQNIAAIVWLHRGRRDRFLALVQNHLARLYAEAAAVPAKLEAFDQSLASLQSLFVPVEKSKELAEPVTELREAANAYAADRIRLLEDLAAFAKSTSKTPPATNGKQHAARKAFDPIAERIKGIIRQVDLLYKLTSRVVTAAFGLAKDESFAAAYDRRAAGKLAKQLEEERKAGVEQLKRATYFHRHILWLQDRFPDAEIQAVPGLVKVVTRKDIENADWSLTPGRFVGVAPAEVDDNFDFEQTISDIHSELAALNKEATTLARTIQQNFEELGV
jgi:type I restriction enzyme M protein